MAAREERHAPRRAAKGADVGCGLSLCVGDLLGEDRLDVLRIDPLLLWSADLRIGVGELLHGLASIEIQHPTYGCLYPLKCLA